MFSQKQMPGLFCITQNIPNIEIPFETSHISAPSSGLSMAQQYEF